MEEDKEEVKPPDHQDLSKMTAENLDNFSWATLSPRDSLKFATYLELNALRSATQHFQSDGSFSALEVRLSNGKRPASLWSLPAETVSLQTFRSRVLTNQRSVS